MSTPVMSISRAIPFHDLDRLNFCRTFNGKRGSSEVRNEDVLDVDDDDDDDDVIEDNLKIYALMGDNDDHNIRCRGLIMVAAVPYIL
ncbi:hypothetical protein BLOT_011847 [Blomia tropicalis]|nr:hypothetical protein BLOT_011847 [Blomia tropicalis]